jgi:predicted alpha-1,2-mannosidase
MGYKKTRGWAKKQHIYFYAQFNKPFQVQLFEKDQPVDGNAITSDLAKAVLTFESQDGPLLAKVGISAVDYKGAENNLEKELEHWDFDQVRSEANMKWNQQLSVIDLKGGSEDQRKIFYTALYHTSISPNIFNDADGRYRRIDMEIGQMPKGENTYTVFSLWDTFRAFHPLLTITNPDFDNELVKTLLRKYEEGGVLPKWELAANYTGTMIGYHSVPVIVDAYFKGIRDFDVEKAYEAMVHAANYNPERIQANNEVILDKLMAKAKKFNQELDYIPADEDIEVVAKALEYAYNDWCIAQMAMDLSKTEDYELYMQRSKRYQKYFDKESKFMRGVLADGTWREPFDPKASAHRKDDYCEGNAWQWTWFVPHDVSGLVDLMGSKEAFTEKLDTFFSMDSEITGEQTSNDISGFIGQYAHGNEPGHHITHMYNFVDQPWKTQKLVDSVLTTLYFNEPNGLAGNEDCGQMSAWYILNAMGMYSFCPGDPNYSLGRPIFEEVSINLTNGRVFTIRTKNNSAKNCYVQEITLNNEPLRSLFLPHSKIIEGGILEFTMGDKPNKNYWK